MSISLSVPGKVLLHETQFHLLRGKKYGLVGANGIGKTSLLKAILSGEIKVQDHIDIRYVDQESTNQTDSKSIFELVRASNRRRVELEKLLEDTGDLDIYQQLADFDDEEAKIKRILRLLGFSQKQFGLPLEQFSGGWRMRVSLACALYSDSHLMLLDEPSNHLDLETKIGLIELLSKSKSTQIIVSHDPDLLSMVDEIIWLIDKTLVYYKGNYDYFKRRREEESRIASQEWKKVLKITNKLKTIPEREKMLQNNVQYRPRYI